MRRVSLRPCSQRTPPALPFAITTCPPLPAKRSQFPGVAPILPAPNEPNGKMGRPPTSPTRVSRGAGCHAHVLVSMSAACWSASPAHEDVSIAPSPGDPRRAGFGGNQPSWSSEGPRSRLASSRLSERRFRGPTRSPPSSALWVGTRTPRLLAKRSQSPDTPPIPPAPNEPDGSLGYPTVRESTPPPVRNEPNGGSGKRGRLNPPRMVEIRADCPDDPPTERTQRQAGEAERPSGCDSLAYRTNPMASWASRSWRRSRPRRRNEPNGKLGKPAPHPVRALRFAERTQWRTGGSGRITRSPPGPRRQPTPGKATARTALNRPAP